MNILPKKRWHVRTRENIARVRKDEQEAAAEAEEKRQRILKAEQEARTTLLRQRARTKYGTLECDNPVPQSSNVSEQHSAQHVNFFEELEDGKVVITKTNSETELEEKEKREKYEKQIGYLTYLGQDTVETTGIVPWYDKVPDHHLSSIKSDGEKNSKGKLSQDPLTIIRKYIPSETKSRRDVPQSSDVSSNNFEYLPIHKKKVKKRKKQHKNKVKKRRKKTSSDSSDNSTECDSDDSSSSNEDEKTKMLQRRKSMEQLRTERLKREKAERERSEELLAQLQGRSTKKVKEEPATPTMQQKYNSQYNPEIAKQNFTTNVRNR